MSSKWIESRPDKIVDILAACKERRRQKKKKRPKQPPSEAIHTAVGVAARAAAYVDKIPGSTCGRGECQRTCYRVAAELVIDFDLTVAEAAPILRQWCDRGTHDWTDAELQRVLENAAASGVDHGRKRDAPLERRMNAEEQATHDAAYTQWWGDNLYQFGPGWQQKLIELRKPEERPQLDFSRWNFGKLAPEIENSATVEESPKPATAFCPHCKEVLMHHPENRKIRLMKFPCQKIACPACGGTWRELRKATIRHHLTQLSADAPRDVPTTVYLWRCPFDQWESASRLLRSYDADYFRLDTTANGKIQGHTFTVLSTTAPYDRPFEEIDAKTAITSLCTAIDALPAAAAGKIWSSSRGWGILKEEKTEPQGWARIGIARSTEAKCVEIMEQYGCQTHFLAARGGWFPWRACEWEIGHRDVEAIKAALDLGEHIPQYIDIVFPAAEAAPADEWATPPTTPPPRTYSFVLAI